MKNLIKNPEKHFVGCKLKTPIIFKRIYYSSPTYKNPKIKLIQIEKHS